MTSDARPTAELPFKRIILDRSSPIPLYYQLAQQLEKAIEDGQVTPGTRMENELDLAAQLSLSRPTARRAMQYLVDKGLVVRRRGIGTIVVSPKVRRPLELTSLYDDLVRAGQRPTTVVLSNAVAGSPPAVAEALGVAGGSPVQVVERLRSASDKPIARMTNYLPTGLLEITTEALEQQGLYHLLRAAGIHLHSATQTIGARTATAAEMRLLGEGKGAALLTMQRTTYDDRGQAVEYGDHIYAATRYSFQMSLLSP